jgi:hypothetical protein
MHESVLATVTRPFSCRCRSFRNRWLTHNQVLWFVSLRCTGGWPQPDVQSRFQAKRSTTFADAGGVRLVSVASPTRLLLCSYFLHASSSKSNVHRVLISQAPDPKNGLLLHQVFFVPGE